MFTRPQTFINDDLAESEVRIVPASSIGSRLLSYVIDGLVLVLPASLLLPGAGRSC